MRIFVTKYFKKWSSKQALLDSALIEAVSDLIENKSVNQLGKFLFKIRVRSSSSGKSGGFRTIVVSVEERRVIFVYGFAKNERDNLSKSELNTFKVLAKSFATLSDKEINHAINQRELFEVRIL